MKDLEKKYCENERGKTESGRKNKATYQKKIPTATPEKYKAKCLVTAGIRNGSIVKQPCSECGDKVVDAHHPDYDKPLDIVWLCRKHHMEVHGKQLHDYSLLSENRKKELRDSISAGEGVGRGGNRKGAGRPFLPEGQKKVAINVKLPPDLIAWMDNQSLSRAVLIERAVREKYGVHPAD